MTRKEWNRLNLQFRLGGIMSASVVKDEVGFCGDCIHKEAGSWSGCKSEVTDKKFIEVRTIYSNGVLGAGKWFPCYYPTKFSKVKNDEKRVE